MVSATAAKSGEWMNGIYLDRAGENAHAHADGL